jgi:GTP diphosphokinase / guanosine-3',5'-bis(diphosphate) 3'-diphosphatase
VPCWEVTDSSHSDPPLGAVQRILKAARFASIKHVKQKRKGSAAEPYLNHLIEVAELVSSAMRRLDEDLICAALLHDVLEDTPTTEQELARAFGPEVAAVVAEVTDDKSLDKAERKRRQIAHAPHLSVRAQTIKIADKISNLRAIVETPPADWSIERKREYFQWARQVVDACPAPNDVLKSEFARTAEREDQLA